jgi:hypothetical protein
VFCVNTSDALPPWASLIADYTVQGFLGQPRVTHLIKEFHFEIKVDQISDIFK